MSALLSRTRWQGRQNLATTDCTESSQWDCNQLADLHGHINQKQLIGVEVCIYFTSVRQSYREFLKSGTVVDCVISELRNSAGTTHGIAMSSSASKACAGHQCWGAGSSPGRSLIFFFFFFLFWCFSMWHFPELIVKGFFRTF